MEGFASIEDGFVLYGGDGYAGFALTPSPSPKTGEGVRALIVPWMTRLRLSVAPEVKIISLGVAPTRFATWRVACLTAASARSPTS